MASINAKKKADPVFTHGGARASHISNLDALVRSVHACMLWESEFYEDGLTIANRIKELVHACRPDEVAAVAVSAREQMKLRHVPLILVRELARHKDISKYQRIVADTLTAVIQRPDEIAEFVSIYQKDKKQPLSKQVKIGLANAFKKFNEYSLAKYSSEGKEYSLRDVLFLVHGKPKDVTSDMATWKGSDRAAYAAATAQQGHPVQYVRPFTDGELLYGRLVNNQLATPDTWEVQLSGGADKKETFVRLMQEGKLGALAFLRNLRNMMSTGVDKNLVREYANTVKVDRILPFRFIAAARAVPGWEDVIEPMMFRCIADMPKIPGKTVFIVDISGSMGSPLSGKSELNRLDTALALAILAREMCEDAVIYATAGSDSARTHATGIVPNRRGFALADAIKQMNRTLGGGGIFLTQVMDYVSEKETTADRVLVLTDEQDCDHKCNPANAKAFGDRNYIINIASAKNGVAYGRFVHVTGWSENILTYIRESEQQQ